MFEAVSHTLKITRMLMFACDGAVCCAASFLGGLMRMSASMCLVLMEMTGAPNTLPFLMMVLIISKGVGDRFNYR
jgi:H+/Cl- antiporter ClcA